METNYQGFVLRGSKINAAESMLPLKDFSVDRKSLVIQFAAMRTYITEFDPTAALGRTPRCFAKDCGRELSDYFMLRDPMGNEIEVQVERRNMKVFFKNGWYGLKDFYDMDIGGWVVFTYDSPSLMFMTIYNRMDEEIRYPAFNHPIIARLDRTLCERGLVELCKAKTLTLTAADVHCGYLVVPWIGFFEESLPHFETDITVVDYLGFYWRCFSKFEKKDHTLVCVLGGEWGNMCKSRRLAVGQKINVAVQHEVDNFVIYLRHVPGQPIERNILTPMTTVISKQTWETLFCIRGTAVSVEVARVRSDMLKLNSYFVEFEPSTDKVRMPACFAKEYGIHIDDVVMLCDRNQNITEVRVEKKKGKVYLRDGWLDMKNFYKIHRGAWIKLTYAEPNMLLLAMRHKSGVEVDYPDNKPPAIRRLLNPNGSFNLLRFNCSSVHILCNGDIESGSLVLTWCDFVRDAFSKKHTIITIVDQSKFHWKCTMQFQQQDSRLVCVIGGDWRAICVMRKFRVGEAIKLGVCDERGSNVVFLTHVPLERTNVYYVPPPSPSVIEKYVYQVNHYFVR